MYGVNKQSELKGIPTLKRSVEEEEHQSGLISRNNLRSIRFQELIVGKRPKRRDVSGSFPSSRGLSTEQE